MRWLNKIYVKKNKIECEFMRLECDKDQKFIESLLDPDSKVGLKRFIPV